MTELAALAPPNAVQPPTTEQAAAIAARDRDVLLEAGAGSGKTRVLVDRYCDAIAEDGVGVDGILAFTFTERAAAELRTRIRRELGRRARAAREAGDEEGAAALFDAARATERAWVTTIHGFCRRLLAAHPAAAGLDPRFRVLDESEAMRLRERAARDAIAALVESGSAELASAVAAYRPWRLGAMTIAAHERLRSQGMTAPVLPPVPEPHRSAKEGEPEPLSPAELESARGARAALEATLEGFHDRYEELKTARSGLDFADLELRALELLEASPAVREAWQGRFEHVMVDEFQDTSRVQLALVNALRGPQTRVFLVGDEHQSIYRFRNADLEVFRAERRRVVDDSRRALLPLSGNFRSTPAVLAAVNEFGGALLEGFRPLTAAREASADRAGPAVELLLTDCRRGGEADTWDMHAGELDPPRTGSSAAIVAEARFLARRLRELVDDGEIERGEIVVLLRAFTHVDTFEEALRRAGLDPYVVGGRGYWSQQQVEDLLCLLGVVANPLDDASLFGALAGPACGASPDALWLLRQAAGERAHVWPALEWGFGDAERRTTDLDEDRLAQISPADGERLRAFCRTLAPLRAAAAVLPLDSLVERTMTAFGYDLALLVRRGGLGRMANVRKLKRLAREFEEHEGRDLRGFLAQAAESTRRDEREGMAPVQAEEHDGVRIMTVHAAKGLEFPVVAVADMGRGLNAGHRWVDDVRIGRLPDEPEAGQGETGPRFGMRLAFPARAPVGLWELDALGQEESEAEAEEGARLVYVAATRAQDRLLLSGTFKPGQSEPCEEPRPTDSPLRRLLPVLAARGWNGGEGELEVEPPKPSAGAPPTAGPAMLRVSLNMPSVERAGWLAERLPAVASGPDQADEHVRPPLGGERGQPVPLGHLSYSALADYERCGYRFYAERLLGLSPLPPEPVGERAEEPGELEDDDELVEPSGEGARASDRDRHLALGNAVHAALEWSARAGWREPDERLLTTLLAREGLGGDGEALARAQTLVGRWLGSALRAELEGQALRPEVPFVLPLAGTVVRGKIDLLVDGARPTVIDFKTDALRGQMPDELARRYRVQRELYALAAAPTVTDGSGVRAIHLFLEQPERPVVQEFDRAALESAERRLGALIERMRARDFEPAADPYPALCYGCPAAARLCPRPAWRPPS
jgi:ATP-dependent helicase/nuclease subunit A